MMSNCLECPKCLKKRILCVCDMIKPLETERQVLILQHPQEPDKDLGSARLARLALVKSELRIGLSWPSLKKILGRNVEHSKWLVLYLGSGSGEKQPDDDLVIADKKGTPLPEFRKLRDEIEGIVVLDGTWSQAKTLWWRNPWLLKLRRGILNPKRRSIYGELRREPRRECLSTIESIGTALSGLGEDPSIEKELVGHFKALLEKYRAARGRNSVQP